MKIALIGATGFAGTALLAELLARDHRVTALVRPRHVRARCTVARAGAPAPATPGRR